MKLSFPMPEGDMSLRPRQVKDSKPGGPVVVRVRVSRRSLAAARRQLQGRVTAHATGKRDIQCRRRKLSAAGAPVNVRTIAHQRVCPPVQLTVLRCALQLPVQPHHHESVTPWCIMRVCHKQAAPGVAPRRPAWMAGGARALLLLALAAQLGRHPAGAQRNVFQQDHPGRPTVDSVHVKTVNLACSSPYTLTQLTSPVFDGYLAALANVFTPTAPLLFNAQCARVPGTVLRTNSSLSPCEAVGTSLLRCSVSCSMASSSDSDAQGCV